MSLLFNSTQILFSLGSVASAHFLAITTACSLKAGLHIPRFSVAGAPPFPSKLPGLVSSIPASHKRPDATASPCLALEIQAGLDDMK